MNQARELWLEQRKSAIGGSEIGSIMGVNPYSTPFDVYQTKVSPDIKEINNIIFARGHALEPVVADEYERRTGYRLEYKEDVLFRHKNYSFLSCTPDRVAFNHDGKAHVVEVKTAVGHGVAKWSTDAPDYCYCQLQYQIGILKDYFPTLQDFGVFAVLLDDTYHTYEYAFDEQLYENMVRTGIEFWREHVEKQVPPPLTHSQDVRNAYPIAHKNSSIVLGSDREFFLFKELIDTKRYIRYGKDPVRIKEAKVRLAVLDRDVRLLFGNHESAIYKGQQIATYRNGSPKQVFDEEQFSKDFPDLYRLYQKQEPKPRFLRMSNKTINQITKEN